MKILLFANTNVSVSSCVRLKNSALVKMNFLAATFKCSPL